MKKQTGMKLIEHPLARSLENCRDVDNITALLQEQARAFNEFRKDDDKVTKSLKSAVCILHAFSTNETLKKHIVFTWFAMHPERNIDALPEKDLDGNEKGPKIDLLPTDTMVWRSC
jgi:hypothetical protein